MLRGNPGGYPLQADAIPAAPLDPEHPPELEANAVARAEWYRLVPALIESRQVTTTDRAILIAYCLTWAQWRLFDTQAASEPAVIERSGGSLMANPTLTLARETLTQLVKLASELGLTPAARSRVSPTAATKIAPPTTSVGKWGALLK